MTTKEWTPKHKTWLVETKPEDMQEQLDSKIRNWHAKLTGIRDFVVAEYRGDFNNLSRADAIERLRHLRSVGVETAPKIALFYLDHPS